MHRSREIETRSRQTDPRPLRQQLLPVHETVYLAERIMIRCAPKKDVQAVNFLVNHNMATGDRNAVTCDDCIARRSA